MAIKDFFGCILDTETTGNDPETCKVIETARLAITGSPLEFMKIPVEESLMDGQLYGLGDAKFSFGAMAANRITPSMLEGKPEFQGFSYYGKLVVGHNIDFDQRVTSYMVEHQICTLALSRYLWPDLDSHSQSAVLLYIGSITRKGIDWAMDLLKNAHRAEDDVQNCARVLKFIIFTLSRSPDHKHHVESWEALAALSLDCKVPRHMPFGKHKGLPIEQGGALDQGYVDWLIANGNTDRYLMSAFRRAGFNVPENL